VVCEDGPLYAAPMELAVDLEPMAIEIKLLRSTVASRKSATDFQHKSHRSHKSHPYHPLQRDVPAKTSPSKPGNGIALCAGTFD